MSEDTGSPVPQRAASAGSSAAGASTISTQQDTDEVVLHIGHESSHIKPIDSHKIRFQNSASDSSKSMSNQEKSKLDFSIHAILNKNRDSNGSPDSKKSQIINPTPIAPPEAKLESFINRNTGQMSRSAVHTPVRPHSKATHTATSNREITVQSTAGAGNSQFSQTAPPGFEAAASAAAVAAASAGAHTVTPWSAAATAQFAAATPGIQPATPWPSSAANAAVAALPAAAPPTAAFPAAAVVAAATWPLRSSQVCRWASDAASACRSAAPSDWGSSCSLQNMQRIIRTHCSMNALQYLYGAVYM